MVAERLLCAISGHLLFRQDSRNVAHRDAGGGAVHSIRSGHADSDYLVE